ncbi:MAG TPA: MATE family efflux transporter [Bacillota bacterium]|nr:MATE family efflux transporter [Bacillota bacterium]
MPKHLFNLAIPVLLANLLTTGYSVINTIWVGNIVGEVGVAAIAVSYPIMFILMGLANGATMATSVLVAQYFGAKDYKMVDKVVNNSLTVSSIVSVTLAVVTFLASDFLLRAMNTPGPVFAITSSYLKLSVVGFIFIYFYFLIAAILRGIGDTVTPLAFLAISTILNAILDPLIIIGIGPFPRLGLNGAAIATLIAQGIALISALIYFNHKQHLVGFNYKKLAFEKPIIFAIFKIGLPSMVQQTLMSVGSAFVTTLVNSFGTLAIAAFGVANRIDSIAIILASAIGMAVTILTGQNIGALKYDRVRSIFKWGLIAGIGWMLFFVTILMIFPKNVMYIFVKDPRVINIGISYIQMVGAAYLFVAIFFVCNGVINGAGQTIIPMIFSVISLWIIRIPFAYLFSQTELKLRGVWLSISISFMVTAIVSTIYYFTGRWKRRAIPSQTHGEIPGEH